MKISGFVIIICLANHAFAHENNDASRIAIVDIESILEYSEAVVGIKKKINEISKIIQKELYLKEYELKKEESALIEQKGLLSQEEFNTKLQEFNKKVSETQSETQKKKNYLERTHSQAMQKVYSTTLEVIKDLSKERGLSMVVPTSQILYADENLNITTEVINMLNERLKSVEIPPLED